MVKRRVVSVVLMIRVGMRGRTSDQGCRGREGEEKAVRLVLLVHAHREGLTP